MNETDPYKTPTEGTLVGSKMAPRPTGQYVIFGFMLAAAIPVLFGIYGLQRESAYAASVPPGTAACGMGSLAALMIMFVGGPFCGMIGGCIGWIISKIH